MFWFQIYVHLILAVAPSSKVKGIVSGWLLSQLVTFTSHPPLPYEVGPRAGVVLSSGCHTVSVPVMYVHNCELNNQI